MTRPRQGIKAGGRTFTTGQAAWICQVAPRTVSMWIDSGRLKGWRIPGSQDRRVSRDSLRRFMLAAGMRELWLEAEARSVLLVGLDVLTSLRLRELLPASQDWLLEDAADGFEAGLTFARGHHRAVVVDLAVGRSAGLGIAVAVRAAAEAEPPVLVALACEDEADLPGLAAGGFGDVFRQPFDPELLAERLGTLLGEG